MQNAAHAAVSKRNSCWDLSSDSCSAPRAIASWVSRRTSRAGARAQIIRWTDGKTCKTTVFSKMHCRWKMMKGITSKRIDPYRKFWHAKWRSIAADEDWKMESENNVGVWFRCNVLEKCHLHTRSKVKREQSWRTLVFDISSMYSQNIGYCSNCVSNAAGIPWIPDKKSYQNNFKIRDVNPNYKLHNKNVRINAQHLQTGCAVPSRTSVVPGMTAVSCWTGGHRWSYAAMLHTIAYLGSREFRENIPYM